MHAAAEGHSTLGIPKKVGEEFDEADPGGKLPKKKKEAGLVKRIMRAFKMNEISAVDRPAQAHAKVVLMKRANDDELMKWEFDEQGRPSLVTVRHPSGTSLYFDPDNNMTFKRDFSTSERRHAASSGAAEDDGSFPIENATDLHNAMRAIGRSKNPSKTRAHIRSRAKALGLESELSDSYRKILTELLDEKLLGASTEEMEKALEDFETTETVMNEQDIKKAVDAAVADATKELADKLAKAEEELAKAKGKGSEPGENDKDGGKDSEDDGDGAKGGEVKGKMKKLELPAEVQKVLDEAKANEIILKQLMDEREAAIFAKRAVSIGLEEMHGEILRKSYTGDKDAIAKLEALMKGMAEQVRTGKIFAEFGSNQSGAGATAADEMNAQATIYREGQIKIGKKCSPQQAFTAVYTDPAFADLKKRYDAEEIKKRHAA